MGLFSGDDSEWHHEFDKRVSSGAPVDRDMWGKPRVQDDYGKWFTRGGKGCCGCGRNRNMGGRDQYGIPEGDPDVKPRTGRTSNGGDGFWSKIF